MSLVPQRISKTGRGGKRSPLLWLLLILLHNSAQGVDIPDSAQPGAVDPSRESPLTLPPQSNEVFVVPPEAKRPDEPDEGDRLFVKSILLRSAVDRPELGIRLQDLRTLVESLRFSGQQLDQELAEGFTRDELAHGAKMLRQLLDDPGQFDSEKEFIVETLVSDLRFRIKERWMTIGNLQQIADEVTKYYQSKGFLLAYAYVPAQTVSNGEVVIQVLEGMIGKVIVKNNKRYTAAQISEPFESLHGMPAFKYTIESDLLQLRDYPGLQVSGVFRPGTDAGTADLFLNVTQEKRHEASVQLDNYGSDFTGMYRAQVSYTNNNVTRAADALSLSLLQSLNPNNSRYAVLNYRRPVVNRHNQIIVDASRNEFNLGGDLEDFQIEGSSDTSSLAWRRSIIRSRTTNHYALFKLAKKRSELSEPLFSSDNLSVSSAEYGFDNFDFRYSGVNIGWVKFSQGLTAFGAMEAENSPTSIRVGGSGTRAGSKFRKFEVRYNRLQRITDDQSLTLSVYAQTSNDLLTSVEQMTIGGPGSVRAYPVSEFLVDTGYFGSVEWILKAPGMAEVPIAGTTWGQVLQYVLFFDTALGRRNDPQQNEPATVTARGIGFGFRFNLKGFTAVLDMAKPLSDYEASNGKSTQVTFKLNYNF